MKWDRRRGAPVSLSWPPILICLSGALFSVWLVFVVGWRAWAAFLCTALVLAGLALGGLLLLLILYPEDRREIFAVVRKTVVHDLRGIMDLFRTRN